MNIYNKFAKVYDRMGADRHSERMVEYCQEIFEAYNIKPQNGLDLCCGTGTAIKLFSQLGIKMSGLDQSASMLAMAAKKLKREKSPLYQKSLPKFKLIDKNNSRKTTKFDLITSFYDSLNYLKNERDLKAAFKSVYQHLEPGGWFIFDMNTPESLKTLWDEHTYAGVKSDMGWIWLNEYDAKKKRAACHATFFKKNGKLYERFDETHYEYGYSNTVIKRFLKESGFSVKGFFECYGFDKPEKKSYRICVICQRVK